jgi:hypothetical protein
MSGIGWAVKQLQDGLLVQREGWNGKGMYLSLQVPDAAFQDDAALRLHEDGAEGDLVPWLCSQTDLLAIDWQLYGGQVS